VGVDNVVMLGDMPADAQTPTLVESLDQLERDFGAFTLVRREGARVEVQLAAPGAIHG
jgi:hypothetical protein